MLGRRRRPTRLSEIAHGIGRIAPHLRPYLRRHRALAGGAALALIGSTLMRLLEPWPLQLVVDHVIQVGPSDAKPNNWLLDLVGQMDPLALLALCGAAVVLIVGIRALCEYVGMVGFALVGNRVLTELRQDLYAKLQRLSLSFHERARVGDLTVRVVGDVGVMRDVAATALLPLSANILILLSMMAVMLVLNWQLALLALAPLPLLFLNTVRLGHRIQAISRKQRANEGSIAAAVSETLTGIRSIQSFAIENRQDAHFSGQNEEALKSGVKAGRLAASLERGTDVLVGISTALVLVFGTRLVLRGQLSAGELLVFLAYLKNAFKPVRDLAKYSARLAKATAAGERVVDLLEEEPDVKERPDARVAPAFGGTIRFEHVGFAYDSRQIVLRDNNLTIEGGRTVALVGPSGAGKSTLASLCLRLYDPSHGRVLIDGTDVREFTLDSLRGQFSVVLQDTLIISDTMRANIGLANTAATAEEIEAAARLANAHEFIAAMPAGYDTILAERGASLSRGQRQRIAVARAALRQAPLLILDEPTAGLDRNNERLVIDGLKRLMKTRTVLLITHDLDLASCADLIVVCAHGELIERGRHDQLLAANGAYAQLYRARQSQTERQTGDAVAG